MMGGLGSGRRSRVDKGPAEAQISVRTPSGHLKCACSLETLMLCEEYAKAVGFDSLAACVRKRVGDDRRYVRRLAKYDKTTITAMIEDKVIAPALRWRREKQRRERE